MTIHPPREVRDATASRTSLLLAPDLDYRVWDLFHFCVLVITITVTWNAGTAAHRPVVMGLLALLAVGYLLIGRRLAIGHEEKAREGLLYLGGVLVVVAIATGLDEYASLALSSLCVQAFLIVRWRIAVGVVAALTLVHPLANLWGPRHSADRLGANLWIAAGITAGSAALVAWIDQLARQSEQRALLIEQLEASRTEVARLSHEAGILSERARLAGEIHDTLAQGYTSILALLRAVERTQDKTKAAQHLSLATTVCQENLAEARAMVVAMAPAALDGIGLADAITRLGETLSAAADLTCEIRTDPDLPKLPRELEVTLLRVTQEALTNIGKHAGADMVTVDLTATPGSVRLVVSDDGVGLSGPPGPGSFGLSGMRSRVEQLGGRFALSAGNVRGTVLTVEVPR